MRTNEIAKKVGIHTNTVRLYEQWGFISPVPREQNGYRLYSELHLKQMQIARYAFRQEFIQNNLRKKATQIVQLSGREAFAESLQAAIHYYHYLQREYDYTLETIRIVQQLLSSDIRSKNCYTHKEVAATLELTEETLRNWERNGLYEVARNRQNRRLYTENDIHKLYIIRTLRAAHFSIASIQHLFQQLSHTKDVLQIVSSPLFTEDFFHVTDDLLNNLKNAMSDVKSLIAILETLQ